MFVCTIVFISIAFRPLIWAYLRAVYFSLSQSFRMLLHVYLACCRMLIAYLVHYMLLHISSLACCGMLVLLHYAYMLVACLLIDMLLAAHLCCILVRLHVVACLLLVLLLHAYYIVCMHVCMLRLHIACLHAHVALACLHA